MLQSARWAGRVAEARRECQSPEDEQSLEKMLALLQERFSAAEPPEFFLGPNRCEAFWIDSSGAKTHVIITFPVTDTYAFTLQPSVSLCSLEQLSPPAWSGLDAEDSSV